MQPAVLMILVAGIVFAVFLILAALVWSIRTRRSEENFIPAPAAMKKEKREVPDPFGGKEPAPDWMLELKRDALDSVSTPERVPIGAEPESPVKDFLHSAFPEISTLIDLGKMVQQVQSAGGAPESSEERKEALLTAVEQMLEEQPDNPLLLQVRDTLQSGGGQTVDSTGGNRVQVVQVAGRNILRVDGIEYYSVADIPDPELRRQARLLLTSLNEENSS